MAIAPKDRLERLFPSLKSAAYRITSPKAKRYNCAAWANGVATRWWEALPGYYWPDGVPRDGTVESYVTLFSLCGFDPCDDGFLEEGFEKIAVYGSEYSFRHVARQLPDGKWTSTLGALEHIEHDSLDGLAGEEYGHVMRFLKRTRGNPMAGSHP